VPVEILDIFGSRAVNFHPAPLPRYRGPDPISAMVLDRTVLTDGAMSLHALSPRFDEGPVIAREPVAFPPNLDIWRYHLNLAQAAARLAGDALPRYLDGDVPAVPQDEAVATYVRVAADRRDLKPDLTADDIRWRCATVAKTRPVRIAGVDAAKAIGFRDVVGPPSGAPPAVGPFSVAFDAADARVRVWRKLPFTSQVRRLRRFVTLVRTPIIRFS
jgi:methionyl-tRNA formyltransferase